jgi:hypothetical protein
MSSRTVASPATAAPPAGSPNAGPAEHNFINAFNTHMLSVLGERQAVAAE